jgi:DNA-directed RNA polymerase II subunit RPB2
MDPKILEKETWKVIYNYFDNNKFYLTKHHQDSYNDFILNKIPQTIKQYNPQILYKDLNKETKKYNYEIHIYYGGKNGDKVYISKPITYEDKNGEIIKRQLYPNEARLRNLTYATNIFCDIEVEYIIRTGSKEETINKTYEKIAIGKIPIMLQSKICALHNLEFDTRRHAGECPYDQGGYFIIDGQEKVIVSHERKVENKLYIVKSGDDLYSYSASIKSVPEETFKYARTTVVNINAKTEVITVRLPMLNKQVPIVLLFRALGIESDKDILKYILYELDSKKSSILMEKLRPSIENNGQIYSKEMALKYLSVYTSGKTVAHFIDILSTDLFPHISDNYTDKAFYLGHVINKLLHVSLGLEKETDRDSFMYKRVDLSGFLLASLFRENFKQFQRDAKIAIDSEYRFNTSQYQNADYSDIINPANMRKIFNQKVIEDSFMKAFKIGKILNKKGLIQSLNRLSSVGSISQLRRINTISDMIMIGQRKLHSTQYGIICPVETPDGGNIGIKKHLTITGHITFGCSSKPVIKAIFEYGTISLQNIIPEEVFNATKVMINGRWLGIHHDPKSLVGSLKLLRRNGLINIFTSISWNIDQFEISILTDGGRCCRPLYIVEDNKILLTQDILNKIESKEVSWENIIGGFKDKNTKLDYYNCEYLCPKDENFDESDFSKDLKIHQSICEFLDTDELNTSRICGNFDMSDEKIRYSHCEIHPSLIMGALGFTIPYCNQSQAPRNVYGTGQTKQSVGMYVSNFRNRFDTSAHVLFYPERPLVKTKLSDRVFINKLPTGMNAVVAIACYTGYNQEDSIIFNKSSLERGLFRSCYFKTYNSTEITDTKNNMEDQFYNPDKKNMNVNLKKEYNYSKIDDHGYIKEGSYVRENDVLISKYSKMGNSESIDSSVAVKKNGEGVVDKVFSDYYNTNKQRMCKVRICTDRMPEIGDKFASRHGQKGTVGIMLPHEDMPFTKDGIVPDLIVNPHAIPSRMTIGQFIECVMGKTCAILGCMTDGTPFTNTDYMEACKILEDKCGFDNYGDEILYSGIMGNQLATKIFIGPTYYQRLKHMPRDKLNSRASGKMTLKTHQPPSGKAAGGGLRIGEMERDALISHGIFQFLKESTMERSDNYHCYISENSGLISIANPDKNKYICQSTSGPLKYSGDDVDELKLNMENVDRTNVYRVNIPYNIKMMIQECEAMGVAMRLIPKPDPVYKKIDVKKLKFTSPTESKKKKIVIKPKVNLSKLNTKKVFNVGNDVKVKQKGQFINCKGKIVDKINAEKYQVEIIEAENDKLIGQKRTFEARFLDPVQSNVVSATSYFGIPEQKPYVPAFKDVPVKQDSDKLLFQNSLYGNFVQGEILKEDSSSSSGIEKYLPGAESPKYNADSPKYNADSPDYAPPKSPDSPDYAPPKSSDSPDYAPPKTFEFPDQAPKLPDSPDYAPPKSSDSPDYGVPKFPEKYDPESPNFQEFNFQPASPEGYNAESPDFANKDEFNFEPGSPVGYNAESPDFANKDEFNFDDPKNKDIEEVNLDKL